MPCLPVQLPVMIRSDPVGPQTDIVNRVLIWSPKLGRNSRRTASDQHWYRERNKGEFTLLEWENLLTSSWVPFCGPNVEAKKLSFKNHLAVRSNSISSVQMSMVTLCIVRTRFLSVSLVCINAMFMYSIYILNVLGPDMINLNQTDHPMMSVIFST